MKYMRMEKFAQRTAQSRDPSKMRLINRRFLIICAALLAVGVLTGAAVQRVILDGNRIYDNAAPAVCYVRGLTETGTLKTTGSCFTVTKDGVALTAAHVVKGTAEVRVVLPSGAELTGVKVLSRDDLTDIAVLRLPARTEGYPALKLGADAPRSGERAYAIGYPLKTTKIMTDGIVSSPLATINGVERLLVSAELASGMSGGPILSQYGDVIGLASATVRTINGVSASPTPAQLAGAVAAYLPKR